MFFLIIISAKYFYGGKYGKENIKDQSLEAVLHGFEVEWVRSIILR